MCVMEDHGPCSTLILEGISSHIRGHHEDYQGFHQEPPSAGLLHPSIRDLMGGVLIVVGPSGFLGAKSGVMFLLVVLVGLASPSVAGILMTGLVDGRAGLSEFRSRLLKWRIGARWSSLATYKPR